MCRYSIMAFMAFLIASSSHDWLVDFLLYVPTILDYTVKQFFVENYEEVIEGKMTYQRNHMSFYPHTEYVVLPGMPCFQ
jgi:hypothetical protein